MKMTLLKLIRRLKRFIKLNHRTKIIFIKAYIYTGFARLFILFVPFNKLRHHMGKYKNESVEDVSEREYYSAERVSFIVNKVASLTPWQSKCLVKALTAQRLLKEEGISTTIYLGVKKDENDKMLAHAWTRCGKFIVTGGECKEGYAVVAKFAN